MIEGIKTANNGMVNLVTRNESLPSGSFSHNILKSYGSIQLCSCVPLAPSSVGPRLCGTGILHYAHGRGN